MVHSKKIRLSRHDFTAIDKAISYIEAHYYERINADQLAIEVNLTKQKLSAGIQQVKGLKLHQYLLKERIERSKTLLIETNNTVKNIACATGFKRSSHFIVIFKLFTTLTPIEYRYTNAG